LDFSIPVYFEGATPPCVPPAPPPDKGRHACRAVKRRPLKCNGDLPVYVKKIKHIDIVKAATIYYKPYKKIISGSLIDDNDSSKGKTS